MERAMRVVITGSSGHLGEALVRSLRETHHDIVGLDLRPSSFTTAVGSIVDRRFVRRHVSRADAVIHAAALHKPHLVTHTGEDFFDINVTGTLNLLEEAQAAGARRFLFTSTTSVYGHALTPPDGAPAVWITEDIPPVPKNVYGVTKVAAEGLCRLLHNRCGLAVIILRTSRFFPEEDDRKAVRQAYEDGNVKANEYLYRRVDLEDVVGAHLLALERASEIGFGMYIISATSPFLREDLVHLSVDAPTVVKRRVPTYESEYARRGWRMFPSIDRVYANERARRDLGWLPRYDFAHVVQRLRANDEPCSQLAREVGSKGYHARSFTDGPYPVE
jgi:UDP-glucose 4-epimerase